MPALPPRPPRYKPKKPVIVAKARAMAEMMVGHLKSMEKTGWKNDGKMLIGDIRKKRPKLKRRVNPIKHYGMGEHRATMPKWGRPKKHPVPPRRINESNIT